MKFIRTRGERQGLPTHILIDDEEERLGVIPEDQALANRSAQLLLAHYPGYPWCVRCSSRQGILTVRLLIVGYEQFTSLFQFVMHLKDVHGDPNLRCVVRAGGELLERWGLARRGIDLAAYLAAKPQFNDVKHGSLDNAIRRQAADKPRIVLNG